MSTDEGVSDSGARLTRPNLGVSDSGARLARQDRSGDPGVRNMLPPDVKNLLVKPILIYHTVGLGVLVTLVIVFLVHEESTPLYFWPAVIAGIAGLPFAFASNVKKLVDAVQT